MQGITTTYHGPTGRKHSSLIAKATGGSRLSYTFDTNADIVTNHRNAAEALAIRLEWTDVFVGACIGNDIYVWVPTVTNTDTFTVTSDRVIA